MHTIKFELSVEFYKDTNNTFKKKMYISILCIHFIIFVY